MLIHIRTHPGFLLDFRNEALSIPDVDNRKVWHEFRVTRNPRLRVHTDGDISFTDKFDPRFSFSVTRQVFTQTMKRAWDAYHENKDFTGHCIVFQRRHPERRIFIPRESLYWTRQNGLRAYARYDQRAASVIERMDKAD